MQRCGQLSVVCLASGLLATSAMAAPFAYATNYRQDLMKIDLNTSATILVGNIGFVANGLAQTSNGKLWATNPLGDLYEVSGGTPSLLTSLGSLSVGALDSAGSTLWGFDNTSHRLFQYNFGSNSIVTWSSVISLPQVQAMSIDPAGNFLVVRSGNKFSRVKNGTWSVNTINNSLAMPDTCTGIDYLSDGNLYAVIFGDDRYQVDPTNGSILNGFCSGVHRDWADMTGFPRPVKSSVPAPAALVAFGIGLFSRRRWHSN